MSEKRKFERLEIRAYADTDPELFAWMAELAAQPLACGEKAQRVRAILLAGLRGGAVAPGGVAVTAAVNLDGLADTLLGQMRPVMEAAVTSALQGLQLISGPAPIRDDEDVDDDFADRLFSHLTLGED